MKKKKSLGSIFTEGLIVNNPIFVQLLGMCPTLATTTSVVNAIGMGAATTAVLIFSNLFISLLRKFIPKQIRIAAYIVIISGFVTMVELLIKAFLPSLDASLGLFIPLIVVNCILLARAEAFASKNGPVRSIVDGLGTGLGFMLALVLVAAVRELIGSGMLFAASDGTGGVQILGDWFSPATIFLMPTGAFLTLGCIIALVQKIRSIAAEKGRIDDLKSDAAENGYYSEYLAKLEKRKHFIKRNISQNKTEEEGGQ